MLPENTSQNVYIFLNSLIKDNKCTFSFPLLLVFGSETHTDEHKAVHHVAS